MPTPLAFRVVLLSPEFGNKVVNLCQALVKTTLGLKGYWDDDEVLEARLQSVGLTAFLSHRVICGGPIVSCSVLHASCTGRTAFDAQVEPVILSSPEADRRLDVGVGRVTACKIKKFGCYQDGCQQQRRGILYRSQR